MTDNSKSAPEFKPGRNRTVVPAMVLSDLAPQQEPEPDIMRGDDLSGVPKIIMAVGRGKTGKTTLLRWMTEMSVISGNNPVIPPFLTGLFGRIHAARFSF